MCGLFLSEGCGRERVSLAPVFHMQFHILDVSPINNLCYMGETPYDFFATVMYVLVYL